MSSEAVFSRLSKWLGLPYQQSQELLARIYGYSNFHELRVQLERRTTARLPR
jgi:hypothetical protein